MLSLAEFTRALALQLKAGLTALEALEQGRLGCRDPILREALLMTETAVRDGETLAVAFGRSREFSPTFVSFVDAGENSGTLPTLCDRLAAFMEADLEAGLETFISLVEPLVLCGMGVVAAVLLTATLQPTMLLLQAL